MPDDNVTGKRLHLERMAAKGLGSHDLARDLVSRVITMTKADMERAYQRQVLLMLAFGLIVGFLVGYLF